MAPLAKQRSSVRWLLSKAYNNRVPEILKDPFYRDHEGQDHLKPQIVVGLGNASIYCQVLSNIYSDPNYQSLNHWSILQTLSRKGVPLNESSDQPLTETVLIQTNPLRINAHMTVIEALMVLYAKEVASSGRISSALERYAISKRTIIYRLMMDEFLSWKNCTSMSAFYETAKTVMMQQRERAKVIPAQKSLEETICNLTPTSMLVPTALVDACPCPRESHPSKRVAVFGHRLMWAAPESSDY
uniref:CASAMP N-terminal domain-containing protein n=1 Tax=Anopheles maculatus TaxID=74869 RepID=A0A182SFA3_9DIPT